MQGKFKLIYSEHDAQESIIALLVKKFQIEPNILRAEMDDTGGVMVLNMSGSEEDLRNAIKYLEDQNIVVVTLSKHIQRDEDKCFDCGSCVSVCLSRAFTIDPATWEVNLNYEKCVACGSCLTACPTHAVRLIL
ncbi:MAG: 4Fe-4S binding protein [Candidatus Methanomethylophilaceae archaeon]|nr:4Fe-4S binding protein [Candidatus Methanomethylophilaceae archaeon]